MDKLKHTVIVQGVIEVKSMHLPHNRMLKQIDKHIMRLKKGLVLGEHTFQSTNVLINKSKVMKIMVNPSSWKVNREFTWQGNKMIFPAADFPRLDSNITKVEKSVYEITLDWSKEAIEQAAYEMTFNYMAEVGRIVYENKKLPKGWVGTTPEEAGYNSIKEKLYYIMLRHLSPRQDLRAIKLYNVYSFGYPLGIGSKEMLWPEDIKKN